MSFPEIGLQVMRQFLIRVDKLNEVPEIGLRYRFMS